MTEKEQGGQWILWCFEASCLRACAFEASKPPCHYHSAVRHLHRQHLLLKHLFGLGHHTAIRQAYNMAHREHPERLNFSSFYAPTASLLALSQSQPASKYGSHANTSSIDHIWLSFKSFSIAFAKTLSASTQNQHHLPTYLPAAAPPSPLHVNT